MNIFRIISLLGSIASILTLIFSKEILSKTSLIYCLAGLLFLLCIIQLIKDNYFQILWSKARNLFIRLFNKKFKYNVFTSEIVKDGTNLLLDDSVRNAYLYNKVYITLKPRLTINSVQLVLFSKLKELTKYGIKAEIFLNDYNVDKETVKYYKNVLKKFIHFRQHSIYQLTTMENNDFSKIFKIKFEKGTEGIKVCWLLSQSANLFMNNGRNNGKLRFDIYKDDDIEASKVVFNDRDVYTSDILYPIFEIINMQILSKQGDNPLEHYFVLSGNNMRNFWNDTRKILGHNFTSIVIPLIKNLTNDEYANTEDNTNCISFTKNKNDELLNNRRNDLKLESIIEHYKLILFKNLDILSLKNHKNELCFDKKLYFSNFEDFIKYYNENMTEQRRENFLIDNFKLHVNKLIDYAD
jgi:hypothetical protein